MVMRVVVFTRLHPFTSHFLSHLLARGVSLEHVVFEGQDQRGIRSTMMRFLEFIFLGCEHFLFARRHPHTEHTLIQRYGDALKLLTARGIGYSFVADHNGAECQQILETSKPDLIVLYGTRIIQEHILRLAGKGTLNIHSAMLPKFRGAKTEFWILLHDDPSAFGVTIHWVEPTLDTGPIVLQEQIPIVQADTPKTLRMKAQMLAPVLLAEAIRRLTQGEELRVDQGSSPTPTFKKPKQEDLDAFRKKYPGASIF